MDRDWRADARTWIYPELAASEQILTDLDWKFLDELTERDRVYLWSSGLLGLPGFADWVSRLTRGMQDLPVSSANYAA